MPALGTLLYPSNRRTTTRPALHGLGRSRNTSHCDWRPPPTFVCVCQQNGAADGHGTPSLHPPRATVPFQYEFSGSSTPSNRVNQGAATPQHALRHRGRRLKTAVARHSCRSYHIPVNNPPHQPSAPSLCGSALVPTFSHKKAGEHESMPR